MLNRLKSTDRTEWGKNRRKRQLNNEPLLPSLITFQIKSEFWRMQGNSKGRGDGCIGTIPRRNRKRKKTTIPRNEKSETARKEGKVS